jgi:predicted DNA-binding transcriptional regulator AlpA
MNRTSKLDARLSSCAQHTPAASHFGTVQPPDSAPPADRILRLPEVIETVRIGRTSLYKMIKAGTFPAPLHLSERIRGWRLSAILQFLASVEDK